VKTAGTLAEKMTTNENTGQHTTEAHLNSRLPQANINTDDKTHNDKFQCIAEAVDKRKPFACGVRGRQSKSARPNH